MKSLADRIGALAGSAVTACTPLSGGDLSLVVRFVLADGRDGVAKSGPDVAIEAEMLRTMAVTGVRVPEVLAVGEGLVLMGLVPGQSGPSGAWDDLAGQLNLLHRGDGGKGEPAYGWPSDYAFGKVAILNKPANEWPAFWAENRLRCHIPHLRPQLARRVEALVDAIGEHLPQSPPPALLHGDLWGGNVMAQGGRVTGLIDPACYHGDREVDAAMLTLFDSPPVRFFDALGLAPGWQERRPVYRLWPLLVHVRLFGGGYEASVARDLAALGC
ncbi:fructosamine kinase family protein [Stakelama tenebrarum]|uniref:Fructosamine kinase family protein n=1 Tax=Stakelama tenebrarum TaxID=2711215 RepID=A0A6G6Y390_9SPHN|nr:fructosamine kinase family protein [Sphingosinithalassobacter tenebrarum]QIG79277.1 fructosamine kinase family protein [Sphingosinithalassobacter tenebrarum]